MSVYWYDTSIVDKIRDITGDDRVSIVPPDTLFRYVANLKRDEVVFPLIAITRLGYQILENQRTPFSSQGYKIGCSSGGENIDELQSVPIRIGYQIDVITRSRKDNDEIVSEILFYFINNPSLLVDIKKGANVSHKFNLRFNEDIVDNSDIESHISKGEYFRSTLTSYVSDARLWKTTSKKPYVTVDPVGLIGLSKDGSTDFVEDININKENIDNA